MTILTNLGTTCECYRSPPDLIDFQGALLTGRCLSIALLLGRLYWHDRRTRKHLPQDMYSTAAWRVMKTIVQSQAVYTIGVIFNLVTFLAKSNLVFVTNAILPPLIVRITNRLYRPFLTSRSSTRVSRSRSSSPASA